MAPGTGIPFGRYLRGPRVGVGGMGEVFFGLQQGLGNFEKPVALKLLLPDLGDNAPAVEMFLTEARVVVSMRHPNIVHVLDVGLEQGRYFIAMEWVSGASLANLVRVLVAEKEQLGASELIWIARGLCAALQHAHTQHDPEGKPVEIIHRDVTPHNVLVSASGEVKLTDFGIAKVKSQTTESRSMRIRGKLHYLAPEQMKNEPVDRRADLYSLGVTLYQLATLVSPFERDTEAGVVWAIAHEATPSIGTLRPDLPESFIALVDRCLSKLPKDRPSSAQEILDLLPESDSSAPATLGALVRRLFPASADPLANVSSKAHTGTWDLADSSSHALPAVHAERVRHRFRKTWLKAGIAAAVAVAAGGAFFALRPPPPEPSLEIPASTATATVVLPVPVPQEATPTAEVPVRTTTQVKPTPQRTSFLAIDALPWAEVYLEGKRIGDTPIARYPTHLRRVTLKLVSPDTGKSATRKVRLTPGQKVSVKVDLR